MASPLDRIRRRIGMTRTTATASMTDQGMDSRTSFTPGVPMQPYAGYSETPRSRDFRSGYNISTRPRINERVAFSTLRSLIDSYDVAQLAISHTVDDVRSMELTLKAAPWFRGDADGALDKARQVLRRPDGVLPWGSWLAKYLNDVLRYDAGALYRTRNRRGDVTGLKVIDGTTLAPLLDDFGDQPRPPAPAYVQFAQGVAWDWLSSDDIIYVPFRPQSNTPYGLAPIEMVLLNANTDLRFQSFFLRRFTEGTIPEGFAAAPADWTPQQIADFQQTWDDLLYGDEAAKHQIKWVPNGTEFTWAKDHAFDVDMAKYFERKTLVAYGRVPADMGITDDVNRSTGDSQADVQFRIGTLPLVRHVEAIVDSFLQDDLSLPVIARLDTGQETEDRVATAQADAVYLDRAVISADEIREKRYGLPVDNDRPFGRVWFAPRPGPIPAAAIEAVQGPIDPETHAPTADAQLPHQVFAPVEGVAPAKVPDQPPLAVERFGDQAAVNADETVDGSVTKAETAGVTSATGITGVDMVDDDDAVSVPLESVDEVRKEAAAFGRFVKARRKQGQWRDFTFTAIDSLTAHRLNDDGRASVRKATGELIAAGLAVRAADTGRVLMLQRAFDEADDAAGAFEFPGGHIETGEDALTAAKREWQEETGLLLPAGEISGSWASPNGVYAGYVYTVASEADVPILDRDQVNNPDDPDGDLIEALAWWTPEHLVDNPAIRDELSLDIAHVLTALGSVVKAGGVRPKGSDPRWQAHPARSAEVTATEHHAEKIRTALASMLPRESLASLTRAYLERS